MELAKQETQRQPVVLLGSLFAGAGAILVTYAVRKWLVVHGSFQPGLWVAVLVGAFPFLLVGCFVGSRMASHRRADMWRTVFMRTAAVYVGIAAGAIVWAAAEELILRRLGVYPIYEEHSLLPFEIILWWIIAAIPILMGVGLGLGLSRLAKSPRDSANLE